MLSKCANPDCSTPFRYFHLGKLFRVETSARLERRRTLGQDSSSEKTLRHLEFYWLCESCAEKLTVVFDKNSGITVRPNISAHSAAA